MVGLGWPKIGQLEKGIQTHGGSSPVFYENKVENIGEKKEKDVCMAGA